MLSAPELHRGPSLAVLWPTENRRHQMADGRVDDTGNRIHEGRKGRPRLGVQPMLPVGVGAGSPVANPVGEQEATRIGDLQRRRAFDGDHPVVACLPSRYFEIAHPSAGDGDERIVTDEAGPGELRARDGALWHGGGGVVEHPPGRGEAGVDLAHPE